MKAAATSEPLIATLRHTDKQGNEQFQIGDELSSAARSVEHIGFSLCALSPGCVESLPAAASACADNADLNTGKVEAHYDISIIRVVISYEDPPATRGLSFDSKGYLTTMTQAEKKPVVKETVISEGTGLAAMHRRLWRTSSLSLQPIGSDSSLPSDSLTSRSFKRVKQRWPKTAKDLLGRCGKHIPFVFHPVAFNSTPSWDKEILRLALCHWSSFRSSAYGRWLVKLALSSVSRRYTIPDWPRSVTLWKKKRCNKTNKRTFVADKCRNKRTLMDNPSNLYYQKKKIPALPPPLGQCGGLRLEHSSSTGTCYFTDSSTAKPKSRSFHGVLCLLRSAFLGKKTIDLQSQWPILKLVTFVFLKYQLLFPTQSLFLYGSKSKKGEALLRSLWTHCVRRASGHIQSSRFFSSRSFVRQWMRVLIALSLRVEVAPLLQCHIRLLCLQAYIAALFLFNPSCSSKRCSFILRYFPQALDFSTVKITVMRYTPYRFSSCSLFSPFLGSQRFVIVD